MYNPDEKNGRPRLGRAKKNISFRISCDRDEADIITIKAARAGMPKAVYIRESAVANTFTPLLSGAEKEFIHEIRKLGSNLNQIAKMAHECGYKSAAASAENIINELAEIIGKVKKRIEK
ncbi:MAG: plasmid mobilization relaxosome protein MobC [Paramuribaculum sp.]